MGTRSRCCARLKISSSPIRLPSTTGMQNHMKSYVSSTTLRVFACNECCLFWSLEMDEKLIELVHKCDELYDMSNKKYSDSVWKEKLWGQIRSR